MAECNGGIVFLLGENARASRKIEKDLEDDRREHAYECKIEVH